MTAAKVFPCLVSIPNKKQALVLIVENEWPTALFRRNIQGKWMITTSIFGEDIFNERVPVSCNDINPVFDYLVDLRRRTRKCTRNRPFHSLWCHLGWGAKTEKLQWMYGICSEIIFIKYEEVQVLTTVNEFLRFHFANYHEIRSHTRRFKIRVYGHRSNVVPSLRALFSVEWMISIKLFKLVANVRNPPLCSSVTEGSKRTKISHIHCNFSRVCLPAKIAS